MAALAQTQRTLFGNSDFTIGDHKRIAHHKSSTNQHEKATTANQHASEKTTLILRMSLTGEMCKACADQIRCNWTTLHVSSSPLGQPHDREVLS
jgi:hypothetical protein